MADAVTQLELPGNAIHLWVGSQPTTSAAVEALAPDRVLSSDEQNRWRRLVRPEDKNSFAWAHLSVRQVLSHYSPIDPSAWEFCTGDHGRPEIGNEHETGNLRFNLSHADGLVAIVVHRGFDAGVDVEKVGRVSNIHSVARTSFSNAECDLLRRTPEAEQPELFVKIWTLKEALLKANGIGGNVSLADFSFDPTQTNGINFSCAEATGFDPLGWSFALGHEPNHHVLAVACEAPDRASPPEITKFDL